MDDVINEVTYICQDCKKPFQAPQGSRRRYCDPCMLKRIKAGKKLKREQANHNEGGYNSHERS